MTDFKAQCGDCGNVFSVVQLPAPLDVAAMLMKQAVCPKCDSKKLFVAPAAKP